MPYTTTTHAMQANLLSHNRGGHDGRHASSTAAVSASQSACLLDGGGARQKLAQQCLARARRITAGPAGPRPRGRHARKPPRWQRRRWHPEQRARESADRHGRCPRAAPSLASATPSLQLLAHAFGRRRGRGGRPSSSSRTWWPSLSSPWRREDCAACSTSSSPNPARRGQARSRQPQGGDAAAAVLGERDGDLLY